ncbi:MAG: hypothetical protein HDR89_09160 [Bacteroides sp.]|nr:hypothetical protein [Bacteroides sp.]MBD5319429.1 hypothetical protein [Bacteroides sp.]MBD5351035.1 hypothetical protein [Bacteroides sp.]MDE6039459.1 hypothetical protein [Paramuribaculum sp.]
MDEFVDNYRDILDLPHHVSAKHPPMSMMNRAAQFAPFAALNGYEEAIDETARPTEQRIELSGEEAAVLSRRLNRLLSMLPTVRPVRLRHFVPDTRKSGGHYVTTRERVRKFDEYSRELVLTDGRRIPVASIISLRLPQ